MAKRERRCTFKGCKRKHLAKGYCRPHYTQLHRGEELRPVSEEPWDAGQYARRSYALKNFLN